jgi:uncharacterized SAM-binding protein YcdF (DUF218 family)
MITCISKYIALPCYPLGLALLLLVAGAIMLFRQKLKPGRLLVLCAIIELYLFSAGPLPHFLVRSFEKKFDPRLSFPNASAIVLLSGGEVVGMPPRLYDEVNDAGDRILYAARLLRQNVAPRLVITGGSLSYVREGVRSQAEAAFHIIAGMGPIDSSRVLLETKAQNTYENGVFTKRLFDSMKIAPDIILVTSAMHMARSVAIFRKLGFTVCPAPTDYSADFPLQWKPISLLPSAEGLRASTSAIHEFYGILAYRLLGRL